MFIAPMFINAVPASALVLPRIDPPVHLSKGRRCPRSKHQYRDADEHVGQGNLAANSRDPNLCFPAQQHRGGENQHPIEPNRIKLQAVNCIEKYQAPTKLTLVANTLPSN